MNAIETDKVNLKIKMCKLEMDRLDIEYSNLDSKLMDGNRRSYHIQEGMVKALEWVIAQTVYTRNQDL
jgi:hypothetical protein